MSDKKQHSNKDNSLDTKMEKNIVSKKNRRTITTKEPLFNIGDIVKHRIYPFRGVIVDVDPEFSNSEEWYKSIPSEIILSIVSKTSDSTRSISSTETPFNPTPNDTSINSLSIPPPIISSPRPDSIRVFLSTDAEVANSI